MIHTGDCLEVMRTLPEASVDAVVTDPPYGLEFMGKGWDAFKSPGRGARVRKERAAEMTPEGQGHSTSKGPFLAAGVDQYIAGTPYQAWCEAWGREALRVTVPGGYLLAFGGTRTHHRLVCGLEDAGWIIRDELDWIYASGFPKGKANLKPAHEPIVLARKPGPLRMLNIDGCRIGTTDGLNGGAYSEPSEAGSVRRWEGGEFKRKPGEYEQPAGRWPANVILTSPVFDGGVDGVVGGGTVQGSQPIDRPDGFQRFDGTDYNGGEAYQTGPYTSPGYTDSGTYSRFFLIPKADRADREPALRGQLAERRKAEDGPIVEYVHAAPDGIGAWLRTQRELAGLTRKQVATHFPSRTGGLTGCVTNWEEEFNRPTPDQWLKLREVIGFDDRYDETMTATCLVTLEERDGRSTSQNLEMMRRVAGLGKTRANHHPTVKPIELMRHLVRLVTPSGGTILDPFLGSGTTAIAAEMEGFAWIGVEKEAEYVAIAEARLNGVQRGLGLDVPAPTRKRSESSGKASGYDWDESVNDNPTRITRNIKSGVHYGDGPKRPQKESRVEAPTAAVWPEDAS